MGSVSEWRKYRKESVTWKREKYVTEHEQWKQNTIFKNFTVSGICETIRKDKKLILLKLQKREEKERVKLKKVLKVIMAKTSQIWLKI